MLSTLQIDGADAADFAQGSDCPVSPDTLAVGSSCTIYVSFTPDSAGPKSASLVIGDNAPDSPQTIGLSGSGISQPQVSLSSGALQFDSQTTQTTSDAQSVTVQNSGGGPLTLNGISLSGQDAGDFAQTNDCPAGPDTLSPGGSCTIQITFTPAAAGLRTATLNLSDDAPDSPQSVSLTGSGVDPGTYFSDDFESGTLSQWQPLTSDGSAVALDSTTANSGTTSVSLSNAADNDEARLAANLAGGGHAQSYTRFCFRIGATPDQGIELANGRAITSEYPLGIRRWEVLYNPVTEGLEAYFFNDQLDRLDLYVADGQVLPNQWYCAEVYLDESSNGIAQVWLNGTLEGTVTGDLSTPSPYSRIYLWNQPAAGTVWFDDIKVASTQIGPTGAGAAPLP